MKTVKQINNKIMQIKPLRDRYKELGEPTWLLLQEQLDILEWIKSE